MPTRRTLPFLPDGRPNPDHVERKLPNDVPFMPAE
jgi:hypothetical protein